MLEATYKILKFVSVETVMPEGTRGSNEKKYRNDTTKSLGAKQTGIRISGIARKCN
jgi:hypothetical protein